MGLKDVFANRKLSKLHKLDEETIKISKSISLGDSARTESMRNHFPKEVASLLNYAKLADELFQYIKANQECAYLLKDINILPPFVVLPWLEPESPEWSDPLFSGYADAFKRMMNQKSPNEILEYCKKYPFPDWWIKNPPCHPVLYQEYWEIEMAETGYDDHWRQALCLKYRDEYCSRFHSKECDGSRMHDYH